MQIAVVTPLFPTAEEPYRGAPIWKTLQQLASRVSVRAYCTVATPLFGIRPRSGRYSAAPPDTSAYGIPSETVHYPSIPRLSRACSGRLIARALNRALGESRPDVILNYYLFPDGYGALRVARRRRTRIVIGARGSDLRILPPSRVVRRQLVRTVREADGILCVSNDLAQAAIRLGAAPERVHAIRNGVDRSVFRPADREICRRALGIAAGERWILYVGWLAPLKGVDLLVESMIRLNRGHGGNWHLALAGEGHLDAALRRQVAESGYEKNFRFLGPQTAAQIAQWMNAADLFCLPSQSEGCPNVVIEALNCGCPVVATRVGGIPELVDDECASLLEERSAGSLAEALRAAADRSWDRAAIAASQSRSWSDVALETLEICSRTMA